MLGEREIGSLYLRPSVRDNLNQDWHEEKATSAVKEHQIQEESRLGMLEKPNVKH